MAAGNLWAVPRLLRLGTVDKIYCLEYSKHRLLQIGPAVLEYYGVPKERVVLALGSFYDLHLKNKSLDFVFMSQAFHHADDPNRLLRRSTVF
jgi:ubiquinone/menaquinone biosynthesis C-methylase UbiE